jgi:hypothetical protein
MDSHRQYSTVHNSACKVIEEKTFWGADGVPYLVAKPGRKTKD